MCSAQKKMNQGKTVGITSGDAIFPMITRWYLAVVCILLPWKLGSVTGPELPNFPLMAAEWIFCDGFPAFFASLLGWVALLLTAACHPWPGCRRQSFCVPLLWSLLVAAGLLGFCGSTETDYALCWLQHMAGVAAFVTAVWWTANSDRKCLPLLLQAMALTGFIGCLHGWWQHFVGLEENYRETMKLASRGMLNVSAQMAAKMRQTRIYGCFTDPNLYASFLIVAFPFSLAASFLWGGRFEYPRVGRWGLGILTLVLFGGALFWSGSRGAAIGFAAGCAAVGFWYYRGKMGRWRWCVPLAGIILALVLLWGMCQGTSRGGMASASTRLQYYHAAAQMAWEHPWKGVGLGEFFPQYLRRMPRGAEVTRNAHCLPLSMLSQCGIFGGLLALLLLLYPWWPWRFSASSAAASPDVPGKRLFLAAGYFASAAWMVHSCFQFNELVPGSVYLAACSMLFMHYGEDRQPIPCRVCRFAMACLSLGGVFWVLARVPGEIMLQQAENAQRKNIPSAVSLYRQAAGRLPHSLAPWQALYQIAEDRQNWREAFALAKELCRRAPHRSAFWQKRLVAACLLGEREEARTAMQQMEQWFPMDARSCAWQRIREKGESQPGWENSAEYRAAVLQVVTARFSWQRRPAGEYVLQCRDLSPYSVLGGLLRQKIPVVFLEE